LINDIFVIENFNIYIKFNIFDLINVNFYDF